jgi:hypothetical protein
MNKFVCVEKNQPIWCAESESVFRIFPAHQFPEIILNEYLRNTENAIFKWLRERDNKVFKVHVVSLVLSLVFKTGLECF